MFFILIDDMSLSLEGKIAIVTGASRLRGIGAQVAYELAKRGAKVSGVLGKEGYQQNLFNIHRDNWLIYRIGHCDLYLPK